VRAFLRMCAASALRYSALADNCRHEGAIRHAHRPVALARGTASGFRETTTMQLSSEFFDRALRTVLAVTLLTALLAGSPSRAEPPLSSPSTARALRTVMLRLATGYPTDELTANNATVLSGESTLAAPRASASSGFADPRYESRARSDTTRGRWDRLHLHGVEPGQGL